MGMGGSDQGGGTGDSVTQREVTLLEDLFLEKEAKKIEKKKKKDGPKLVKLLGEWTPSVVQV
jgi:hypothetical protein